MDREPGGLQSVGSGRVTHNSSNLALKQNVVKDQNSGYFS